MEVFEITVGAADDVVKDRIARMLCPDEHHAPPCPVPWSFTAGDDGVVLAVVANEPTALKVATQVEAITGNAAPVTRADTAAHEVLVEQATIERGLRL